MLTEQDLNNLVEKALNNRPEIKQMLLQKQISESLVKLIAAGNKPNIVVIGSAEWQNTELEKKNWYNTWSAAAVLNIPIFDGLSTYYKTKQAKSNLEQVILSKELLEEGIKLEVRSAYFSYKQAKGSILNSAACLQKPLVSSLYTVTMLWILLMYGQAINFASSFQRPAW